MFKNLISVIVTTYKRDYNMLKQSLDSIYNQSYKNIEIILIDDNPGENNYSNIIKNSIFKFKNLKYIKHAENKGVQYSRNEGIALSSGDFVAFLDDDDIWLEQKLEEQIKAFTENVGLVYCKGYYLYNNKIKKYYNCKHFKRLLNYEDLLEKDYIGTTSQFLVRKSVFQVIGNFDENLKSRQDYDLSIRISQKYDIVGVDKFLFKYRVHNGEKISKNIKNQIDGYMKIYYKHQEKYDKNKKLKSGISFYLAYAYWLDENYYYFKKYSIICLKGSFLKFLNLIRKVALPNIQ